MKPIKLQSQPIKLQHAGLDGIVPFDDPTISQLDAALQKSGHAELCIRDKVHEANAFRAY